MRYSFVAAALVAGAMAAPGYQPPSYGGDVSHPEQPEHKPEYPATTTCTEEPSKPTYPADKPKEPEVSVLRNSP